MKITGCSLLQKLLSTEIIITLAVFTYFIVYLVARLGSYELISSVTDSKS